MNAEKDTSYLEEQAPAPSVSDAHVETYFTGTYNVLKDSPEERRLRRRLDRRILPIACLLYFAAYLERSNIGNARLQGLPQDTLGGDPTGVLFEWVTSVFYFPYILCQVPAIILSKKIPPKLWLGMAAVGWGICSTLMATAFNFGGLMACRIGLGFFETAFAPGIPLYFSFFYIKEELGLRLAYFCAFAAVAGAFGSLIAFGIQNAHTAVENWRLLFIIEGCPSVILGVVVMLFLPNRPESTSFFNEEERKIALARINRDMKADVGAVISKNHIYSALKDWKIYIGGVIYFGLNNALAGITAFLPTIIRTFGDTNAKAQLLTVPPYAVAALYTCAISWTSDRIQNRGCFMAGSSTLAAIGYLLLLITTNVHSLYFATFCITSGTYSTLALTIAWYAHNLGSETKKATGLPLFMAIGQSGSVLGSQLYPTDQAPRYIQGYAVTCGLLFLAAICCVILTLTYTYKNAQRDRLYGLPNPGEEVDTSELADEAPSFRYIP